MEPVAADFPAQPCHFVVAPLVQPDDSLPHRPPRRILVFGDTGCRVLGPAIQACNDPRRWPFALVAAKAAAQKPDLVIRYTPEDAVRSPFPNVVTAAATACEAGADVISIADTTG